MIAQAVPIEPGDYIVQSGHDVDGQLVEHRFENVTFSYTMDDSLAVMRGGTLIAQFRWWDSIRRIDL